MAQLTIKLHVSERDALFQLARREERDPRAQVRLIVRRELRRRGLLRDNTLTKKSAPILEGKRKNFAI